MCAEFCVMILVSGVGHVSGNDCGNAEFNKCLVITVVMMLVVVFKHKFGDGYCENVGNSLVIINIIMWAMVR